MEPSSRTRRTSARASSSSRSSTRRPARWRSRRRSSRRRRGCSQAICEALGWEYGALWDVDRAAPRLRCAATWHAPSLPFDEFAAVSRRRRLRQRRRPAGTGLGRAASPPGFPTSSATRTSRARRSPSGRACTRRSASRCCSGADVLGVMEFFSREIREPDAELLAMLTTVGSQIGLFVERKRAEEELDRFFTLSLDLLCVANFDGYFVRLNPAWERMLGIPREELLATPWLDFVHPDDREATIGGDVDDRDRRRELIDVREPLSLRATDRTSGCSGRAVAVPDLGLDLRASRATSPTAESAGRTPRARESPSGAPRRRRSPRASSSPT